MADNESGIWNQSRLQAYWDATDTSERRRSRLREGADVADDIDNRWQSLAPIARALLRYMILSRASTLIAMHKDDLLDSVIATGLLRKPLGVDTLLLHSHDTTYDVPPAVWRTLNEKRDYFLSHPLDDAIVSEGDTIRRFKSRYRFVQRK